MSQPDARRRAEELSRKLSLAPYDSRRITLIEEFVADAVAQAVHEYRTKARGPMADGTECDLCEEVVTKWEWVDKGWSLACKSCLEKIRAQAVAERDAPPLRQLITDLDKQIAEIDTVNKLAAQVTQQAEEIARLKEHNRNWQEADSAKADEISRLTQALASKIGPDWREALPYETEIELAAEIARLRAALDHVIRVYCPKFSESTRRQVIAEAIRVALAPPTGEPNGR